MGNENLNPYNNPYLPSFVSQRPRMYDNPTPRPVSSGMLNYGQIKPVSGFAGAREYATNELAMGASAIVVESNPDMARVYITAKGGDNQITVSGFDLVPVPEPKPVTIEDVNEKLNRLMDRFDKLEEKERNDKPVYRSGNTTPAAQPISKPAKDTPRDGNKQP